MEWKEREKNLCRAVEIENLGMARMTSSPLGGWYSRFFCVVLNTCNLSSYPLTYFLNKIFGSSKKENKLSRQV